MQQTAEKCVGSLVVARFNHQGDAYYLTANNPPRIYRLDALSGVLSTIVGSNTQLFSADGQAGVGYNLDQLGDLVVIPDGSAILFRESRWLRSLELSTMMIETIAGQ